MRGYKSRNTYTVSGTVGGFYLKPTDVKLSFYQAKDGTVVPSCTACSRTRNCCNARSMNTSSPSRNRATCKALATWAASLKSKTRKRRANPRVRQPGQVHARTGVYAADKWKCPDTICNVQVSPEQKAAFEAGQAVKMENLQFRDGTKRSAYLQVSAVERGLEFLPRAAVQFLQQGQQPAEQQVAGLKDGKGVEFNGHVQPGAQANPPTRCSRKTLPPPPRAGRR